MILTVIYFLVFCFLVSKVSFFKDSALSFKFLLVIIILKVIGCFAYYWFYFINPHGIKGDSSDTLMAADLMYNAFSHNKADFFKMIFGLHSDLITDPLYEPYFRHIDDWGESDSTSEFFLNDNRTSIRFHAFLMLFSKGYYATHALVLLIISFTGQLAFYKTFKSYVPGKEKLLAIIIFLTPSVLFWSSGVLKEPLAIGLLGVFMYCFYKLFITKTPKLKYILLLLGCSLFFIILKPYILVIVLCPLILFVLVTHFQIKRVALFYLVSLVAVYSGSILTLKFVFHKDVINTIVVRQNDFISLSKGGIFFVNDKNYLRLEYKEEKEYKIVDTLNDSCRLNQHISLMYWNLDHIRDTVFVADNHDISLYKHLTTCKPAGSGITMERLQYSVSSFAKLVPVSFYNVLCRPFFYDAHSSAELVASIENLLFFLFFIFCMIYRTKAPVNKNLLALCLSIVVLSFLLIGITTTVEGAIVRYKIPFIPFLLLIPLLYLDKEMVLKNALVKRFLGLMKHRED